MRCCCLLARRQWLLTADGDSKMPKMPTHRNTCRHRWQEPRFIQGQYPPVVSSARVAHRAHRYERRLMIPIADATGDFAALRDDTPAMETAAKLPDMSGLPRPTKG